MNDGKIRIFLLVLLVAGMTMVPMVNAADTSVQQLPEPQQVPMDEKTLKEMQKEIIKELQASTVIDNKEKNLLIKQLKEIWSGKSSLSESERREILTRVYEVLMQSSSSGPTVQWSGCSGVGCALPHNDMAKIAGQKMGLSSNYVKILYDSAGDPDSWFGYSYNHYALTGAPENTRDYANLARSYIKNGNSELGYKNLAYSMHFMTDMSQPFHYFYDGLLPHKIYEDYVGANWITGQAYISVVSSNYYYYYITDPYASASNLARYSVQYKAYIISAMDKPGWQTNPTLVQDTKDCLVQGERYDMGLVNYATRA
jgi:hypothetical protein